MRLPSIATALVLTALVRPARGEGLARCDAPELAPRLGRLLGERRFADVHHAATSLRVLCGELAIETIRVLDDLALLGLEDRAWAIRDLEQMAASATDRTLVDSALAWAYASDHDDDAARAARARLPAPRAAALAALAALDDTDDFAAELTRLPLTQREPVRRLAAEYHAARHTKRPVLAGVLSAIVPGAGQVYSGSWQAAGVTLALNAIFVASTVELARARMYATAIAAGTASSFFYVGGIINAADLARRRNEQAAAPYLDQLTRTLVPELTGAM